MKKTLIALALIGIGSTTSAYADSLLYGGVSVGRSSLGSEDATSYSAHVGTGILPFIGVEGGYTNHGNFSFANGDVSADSWYAALKPSINIGPVQLYAKGGAHYWDLKSDNNPDYKNDNGTDFMYGVGADYEIFGPLTLGANYTNYNLAGRHVDSFNLTLSLNFL
ncbi:porin [Dongshaea marina]|uniref:porin n=1 Tax=Dongshaea marina TaxID=2047966 RepID=UPI000D3E30F0|nr:porin [Dongshaea marina]